MKRFLFVLGLSLFIFMLSGSCSFANSVNVTNGTEFVFNGTYVEFFDEACKQLYGLYPEDITMNNSTSYTKLSDVYNRIGQTSTWNVLSIFLNDRNNEYDDFSFSFFSTSSTGYWGGNIERSKTGVYSCHFQWYSSNVNDKFSATQQYYYMVAEYKILTNFSSSQGQYYKANWNTINAPSMALKYISLKNDLISINVNGTNESFIKANYNLYGWINIGYLQNYRSYDELQGYFSVYAGQSNVDNANYYDTIGSFQYNKITNNQYTNNLRVDYDNGNIYLNTLLCSYNHGYSLYFTGNGVDTTNVVNYYFVPLNSIATSGDINNDNPTNLDFDFINSVEFITQYNSGNVELLVNNFIGSGDKVLGVYYDNNNFDNWGFGDFVNNIVQQFFNIATNYENISIDMGYLGTWNSSQFISSDDNAFFNIVSFLVNSLLLLGCVRFFYKTIISIGTLDIDKIVKDDEDLLIM